MEHPYTISSVSNDPNEKDTTFQSISSYMPSLTSIKSLSLSYLPLNKKDKSKKYRKSMETFTHLFSEFISTTSESNEERSPEIEAFEPDDHQEKRIESIQFPIITLSDFEGYMKSIGSICSQLESWRKKEASLSTTQNRPLNNCLLLDDNISITCKSDKKIAQSNSLPDLSTTSTSLPASSTYRPTSPPYSEPNISTSPLSIHNVFSLKSNKRNQLTISTSPLRQVPAFFFEGPIDLTNPVLFRLVFFNCSSPSPSSSSSPSLSPDSPSPNHINPLNTSHMHNFFGLLNHPLRIQERLSKYLDLVEDQLAISISLQSNTCFTLISSTVNQLTADLQATKDQFQHIRMLLKCIQEECGLRLLESYKSNISRRNKLKDFFSIMEEIKKVRDSKEHLQLLLKAGQYSEAYSFLLGSLSCMDNNSTDLPLKELSIVKISEFDLTERRKMIENLMITEMTSSTFQYLEDVLSKDEWTDEKDIISFLESEWSRSLNLFASEDSIYITVEEVLIESIQQMAGKLCHSQSDKRTKRLLKSLSLTSSTDLNDSQKVDLIELYSKTSESICKALKLFVKFIFELNPKFSNMPKLISPIFSNIISDVNSSQKKIMDSISVKFIKQLILMSPDILKRLYSAVSNENIMKWFKNDALLNVKYSNETGLEALTVSLRESIKMIHHQQHEQLGLVLTQETWDNVQVPREYDVLLKIWFQDKSEVENGQLNEEKNYIEWMDDKNSKFKFYLVNSSIVLFKALHLYTSSMTLVPSFFAVFSPYIYSLIQTFDQQSRKSILLAGAIQSAGLKSVTARHIVLALQSISFSESLSIYFKRFIPRNERRDTMTVEWDQLIQNLKDHQDKLYHKLVDIMADRFSFHIECLSKVHWESFPPRRRSLSNSSLSSVSLPSDTIPNEVKNLSKEMLTLYKITSSFLPIPSLQTLFSKIASEFMIKFSIALEPQSPHSVPTAKLKTTSSVPFLLPFIKFDTEEGRNILLNSLIYLEEDWSFFNSMFNDDIALHWIEWTKLKELVILKELSSQGR